MNSLKKYGSTQFESLKNIVQQLLFQWNHFNPLSLSSDQHQISPHHINAVQHIQVVRIKEMITKDELCRCVKTFSQLVLNKIYQDQ